MPRFDSTTGRYTYLTIEDVEYRLYFEEAGSGEIGLLLQHTANSTSGQPHLLGCMLRRQHQTAMAKLSSFLI